MEKPTLFNPFTQIGNYKKEDLMKLPNLKRNIIGKLNFITVHVDLREVINENKEFTDKLNDEKAQLENQ